MIPSLILFSCRSLANFFACVFLALVIKELTEPLTALVKIIRFIQVVEDFRAFSFCVFVVLSRLMCACLALISSLRTLRYALCFALSSKVLKFRQRVNFGCRSSSRQSYKNFRSSSAFFNFFLALSNSTALLWQSGSDIRRFVQNPLPSDSLM